jgi:hypothetical protein
MQTFLPYPDFKRSAACLDYRRLGKQRIEALTILKTIKQSSMPKPSPQIEDIGVYLFGSPPDNSKLPWINHPATRMWQDYRWALAAYTHAVIDEWENRGYEDNVRKELLELGFLYQTQDQLVKAEDKQKGWNDEYSDTYPRIYLLPHWLGRELVHSTHRSKLLEKDNEYYSRFCWEEEPGAEYYWPV